MKYLIFLFLLIPSAAFSAGSLMKSMKIDKDGKITAVFANGERSLPVVPGVASDPIVIKSKALNSFPVLIKSSDDNGGHDLWRFYEDASGHGVIQVLDSSANADVILSAAGSSKFDGGITLGSGADVLNTYDDQTFTSGVSWLNVTGDPSSYTIRFVQIGTFVTAYMKFTTVTTSGAGTVELDQAIPSSMAPTDNASCVVLLDGSIGVADDTHAVDFQNDRDIVFYEGRNFASFGSGDAFQTAVSGNRFVTCSWLK